MAAQSQPGHERPVNTTLNRPRGINVATRAQRALQYRHPMTTPDLEQAGRAAHTGAEHSRE
ncbi:hypothetical protein BN1012_Phect978 [Candidatus Phaeomarinobacter ectocarpi]|uniref:Uncharacterized protein n=1 Tax=Candidatus Phaeomarinibacter ectocarpi TaxID=1458461 RepID=X5MCH5_9HYPH|nr:hypothetical protein BN1012_Phect978 [Candidatus Phaeomarinobacter ectocarpi]